MENLNSVKKLLRFLDNHGPGQWVIITNELGMIFPAPEFRFKYSGYAEQIKAFLYGIESEGLVQIKIGNREIYDSAFGDLNNVFCDLEKHDIQAKITKEGLEYIGILGRLPRPTFYVGPNAQLNYQSPGANIVHNDIQNGDQVISRTSVSNQTQPHEKESFVDRIKRIAKTITGAKAVLIALISFLSSFGILFSLWKSNNLSRLLYWSHKAIDSSQISKLDSHASKRWPSNLKYIDLDTLTRISPADSIFIGWIKGHQEDSIIAQKLYFDMANAGYKPQQIQELVFIDKMDFKHRQYKLESHLFYDNSKKLLVTINPEFNFFKQ